MEQSILKSTKRVLHLNPDDDSFDLDIIMRINSAFSDLNDLGVGPDDGFEIEDDTTEWADYLIDDPVQLNSIRNFVLLKTRLGFDPPSTGFLLTSAENQLKEIETRISIRRENEEWLAPQTSVIPDVIDGGDAG